MSEPTPDLMAALQASLKRARADRAECDGLCMTGADVGVPSAGIAYPHPGCPKHAPGEVCGCGMPDRCTSYTHDPAYEGGAS